MDDKRQTIKCLICGEVFEDMGCHPLICLNQGCIREAYRHGWWDLTYKQRQQMRCKAVEVSVGAKE